MKILALLIAGVFGLASTILVSAVELVSINTDGVDSGDYSSTRPSISTDGRFVVFSSYATDLVDTDTNRAQDIFLRDLHNDTTTLISVNKDGTDSGAHRSVLFNGKSSDPVISANARFVAFASNADDLVDFIPNYSFAKNIYIRDLQAGTTTLVSVNKDGNETGSHTSEHPVISADGGFVAFTSYADNLVDTDTNDTKDVFVRNLRTGVTSLASVNKDGNDSGSCESKPPYRSGSDSPSISADGRFLAFESYSEDLVEDDTNECTKDIFVRDLQNNTTTLVSINKDGTGSGNGYAKNPMISANGRFIAFASTADDLVDTDTDHEWDVFVRDLENGITTLVSINRDETHSGSCSSNHTDCQSLPNMISPDGRFVTFNSFADDLVDMDSNNSQDIFVRDLLIGTTHLVSVNQYGTDSGACPNDPWCNTNPATSPDGRFVAFASSSNDLVDTYTNDQQNIFVRDIQNRTTILVSINNDGISPGNSYSETPAISPDGRIVAFSSDASNLVDSDSNETRDIFVSGSHDIQLSSLTLDNSYVNGGNRTYGTVTLNDSVPFGYFRVSMSSSHPEVATVPDSIIVPAGAHSNRFVITTKTGKCATHVNLSATGTIDTLSESIFVASDNRKPATPRGFNKSTYKARFFLYWDSLPNVEQFILDRRINNREWHNIAELQSSQTLFTPPRQTPCNRYRYRLRAANHCGISAPVYIGHFQDDGNCPFSR